MTAEGVGNGPVGIGGGFFCDFNAGAPVLPEVLEAFVATERRCPANPASSHTAGRRARGELERARRIIAESLQLISVDDVVFTSGGTESANLAVRGLGDPDLPVLLSQVEHPAVRAAADQRGVVLWSHVHATGAVEVHDPEVPVGLVCLAHAQSELGTLQPVADAIALGARLDVPVLVDAAQTLGREPLAPLLEAGAVLALSAHKCGGLRGHGVLVGRDLRARSPRPLLHGGAQEGGLRPGTQSPSLAVANAIAIERAVAQTDARRDAMRGARDAFLEGVGASGCAHRVLTPMATSLANTVMLCFESVDGRNLLPALDLGGVFASHGSACSSGSPTPPPILRAIGLDERDARACVRFSFDWRTASDHAREAGARAGAIVARLQQKK